VRMGGNRWSDVWMDGNSMRGKFHGRRLAGLGSMHMGDWVPQWMTIYH